ncbi:heat-shock protein, partial [Mesorhizobium sp. M7A.F.Ca.CA.004.05.1.1]
PEELKPRRIEIGSEAKAVSLEQPGKKQLIDSDAEPQREVA